MASNETFPAEPHAVVVLGDELSAPCYFPAAVAATQHAYLGQPFARLCVQQSLYGLTELLVRKLPDQGHMTADHIDGQIEMARVLIEESREGLAEATACASKEFDPLDWRLLSSCTIGFSAC